MAHAYVFAGNSEEGIEKAKKFAKESEVLEFRYGLLSVDEARDLIALAQQGPKEGKNKFLIVSATRFFHEAQNALLKLFEEPPRGVVIVLVVPTAGILLPTLMSRLTSLPGESLNESSSLAEEFLSSTPAKRETLIEKLLERTKSDKDEEKQKARAEALDLIQGIIKAAHTAWEKKKGKELELFLQELDAFIPLFHDRATPYKMIFEHILIVMPKGIGA